MAVQLLLVPLRIAGARIATTAVRANRDPKLKGNIDFAIETTEKQLKKKLGKFRSKLSTTIDKGVRQAGFQLLDIIRTKTAKGIDINSRKFAPYSSGYLKKLNREGKKTAVDLFYTGRMLGSLSPNKTIKKTGRHKVTLAFTNAQMRQRALYNQVLNEPKRVFFGFNRKTEKIINKSFQKFIKKELRI